MLFACFRVGSNQPSLVNRSVFFSAEKPHEGGGVPPPPLFLSSCACSPCSSFVSFLSPYREFDRFACFLPPSIARKEDARKRPFPTIGQQKQQLLYNSTYSSLSCKERSCQGQMSMASLIEPRGNAMPLKYAEELIATARAITAPGKGILAADESTGTIGKRVSYSSDLNPVLFLTWPTLRYSYTCPRFPLTRDPLVSFRRHAPCAFRSSGNETLFLSSPFSYSLLFFLSFLVSLLSPPPVVFPTQGSK